MEPLVDTFGRRHAYLRLAVTDRCNLRCVYCMPASGVTQRDRAEILSFAEITRLAALFAALGVRKIRLTGGEPILRRNLPDLIAALAAIPGLETLALTTNGVLLPELAPSLKSSGLQRLNVSLDTLRPDRFKRIALRPLHARVLAGIDAALAAGFAPLKLNVVVMGGVNDDELLDFVDLARNRPLHVRFIEYMPFKANRWGQAGFVPYAAMRRAIEARHRLIPHEPATSTAHTAKTFQVEGHCGSVGFITPMSESFCQACDRLRLTTDGRLKTCLFTPPSLSLRDALRGGASDELLASMIREALVGKHAVHPPLAELAALERESMIEIGG